MIAIFDITSPPASVSGMLSRLGIELRAGLYLCRIPPRVRDQIWIAVQEAKPIAALCAYSASNELGFDIKTFGDHPYSVVDYDGISLVSYLKTRKVAK